METKTDARVPSIHRVVLNTVEGDTALGSFSSFLPIYKVTETREQIISGDIIEVHRDGETHSNIL